MSIQWSSQQQAVIDARKKSVLVSAAAGSGKTAVLVERLIQLLTDEQHPVDIERLLVVTFTNAAASEMRERIGKGLDKKLLEEPENTAWIRQKLLLPCAQISTIHSLCLKTIREHFEVLELDPSFRLADEAELKLLKSDVAEEVLETFYASENRAFRDFVDRYANGKADQGIAEMVMQLYDYSRGFPWPQYWMKRCLKAYTDDEKKSGARLIADFAMNCLKNLLTKFQPLMARAQTLSAEIEGLAVYLPVVDSDREWLDKLQQAKTYDQAREVMQTIRWQRLPRTSASLDSAAKESLKYIHTMLKSEIEDLRKSHFVYSYDALKKEMCYIYPSIRMLTELTEVFGRQLQQVKKDRNMLDFSDLEHGMLQLLADFSEDDQGNMQVTPTSVADELSDFYEEVVCDEYQDSNQVQELILSLLSRERKGQYNRFMVGDVKQSIYRFRLADAAIFMGKYDDYAHADAAQPMQRIDLSQNFRSRECVLASVNSVFRRIMKKSLGGIAYDDQAALYPGRSFPEAAGKNIAEKTELLFLAADGENADLEEETDPVELEAKLAAVKIKALTDAETGLDIYDDALETYRKASYKDIVILLRTVTGWAEKYVNVLSAEDIPVTAEMSAGFFDTLEIQTMLQLLAVIDNPGQDIPLAAVLCSPVAGMTSEELAMIRVTDQEGNLYSACVTCDEETPGYAKLQNFLRMLKDFRQAAIYMELHELLRYIYDKSGYYDYVQALPGGERRRANLDLLREKAAMYAAGSYSSLFDFMRYIEQLKKNQIDFGEAIMPEGDKGRVRIMSIHKSKGLEYPIVILAGLGKKFNFQDSTGKMVLDAQDGIGLDAINLQTRKKMASAYKKLIAAKINLETLAEEQRILYVAMTRAKEQLIMTGMDGLNHAEEKLKNWKENSSLEKETLPDWLIMSARSYLDWLMPVVMNQKNPPDIVFRTVDIRALAGREVVKVMDKRWLKEKLLERKSENQETMTSEIAKNLQWESKWQYPYQALLSVKAKYSVSELKKHAMEEEQMAEPLVPILRRSDQAECESELPSFMKDAESPAAEADVNTGAFRGTAYHRALELLNFADRPKERHEQWLLQQLNAMVESQRLSEIQRKSIRLKDLADMVFSELGSRMADADRRHQLHREAQFVMGVPVTAVHPDIQSEETVLIQGIIDAYFEEDGQLILVDYKTDHVAQADGAEILKSRYKRQLDDYQYALEQMLQKKVGQKLIYAFALKTWIDI